MILEILKISGPAMNRTLPNLTGIKTVRGGHKLFVTEISPRRFSDQYLIAVNRRRRQLRLFPPHVFPRELVAGEERNDRESPDGLLLDRVYHLVPLKTVVLKRRDVRRSCR